MASAKARRHGGGGAGGGGGGGGLAVGGGSVFPRVQPPAAQPFWSGGRPRAPLADCDAKLAAQAIAPAHFQSTLPISRGNVPSSHHPTPKALLHRGAWEAWSWLRVAETPHFWLTLYRLRGRRLPLPRRPIWVPDTSPKANGNNSGPTRRSWIVFSNRRGMDSLSFTRIR